jgi:hypothetical protein
MAGEMLSVDVAGLKELDAALKQLPDRIARNVLRGAVRAGAAEIRNEAKLKAPVYTGQVSEGHPRPGTLKRAIYLKQASALSSLVKQTFVVGVRTGPKVDRKTKKPQTSIEDYEANLRKIVDRLQKETKAKLIFATTTPIRDELHAKRKGNTMDRYEADVKRYNKQLAAYHRMKALVGEAKAHMSLQVPVRPRSGV